MAKQINPSSSPFNKKEKYFFPSFPPINISSEDSYSHEELNLQTSKSSSKNKNFSSLQLKRNNSNVIGLVNNISDVFDKAQINSAVSKANNYNERIKVVDFVLKRRNQIKETEDKVKLERVAPLLKNFQERCKTKNKIETVKTAKFRESVQYLSDDYSSFPTTDLLTLTGKIDTNNELQNCNKKRLLTDMENSFRNSGGDILDTSRSNQKDVASASLNLNLEKFLSTDEGYQRIKTEEPISAGGLLSPNMKFERKTLKHNIGTSILECRKKSITPSNIKKAHIIETFKSLFVKKNKEEESDYFFLKPKKPKRAKRPVLKSIQDEANTALEKDIYNYLVKNGEKDRDILKSFRYGKISKVKAIESRALTKFDYFQSQIRDLEIPERSLKPFKIKSIQERRKPSFLE